MYTFPLIFSLNFHVFTSPYCRVARWFSQKYRKLAVPVSMGQNIELFTHALSGITIIFILDKESKYRTVRLHTGHLATIPYFNRDPFVYHALHVLDAPA